MLYKCNVYFSVCSKFDQYFHQKKRRTMQCFSSFSPPWYLMMNNLKRSKVTAVCVWWKGRIPQMMGDTLISNFSLHDDLSTYGHHALLLLFFSVTHTHTHNSEVPQGQGVWILLLVGFTIEVLKSFLLYITSSSLMCNDQQSEWLTLNHKPDKL